MDDVGVSAVLSARVVPVRQNVLELDHPRHDGVEDEAEVEAFLRVHQVVVARFQVFEDLHVLNVGARVGLKGHDGVGFLPLPGRQVGFPRNLLFLVHLQRFVFDVDLFHQVVHGLLPF